MKRRLFLNAVAATSAGALAGSLRAEGKSRDENIPATCKITVLKKTLQDEFVELYSSGDVSLCSVFEEGQEFVIESPWNPPEGFCNWAWADIRTYIHMVNAGGYDTMVACCTDGFRPVFFKIERVES